MSNEFRITVDTYTCRIYNVSPNSYQEKLKDSAVFSGADIVLDSSNESLAGDYSTQGAIMLIANEGPLVDHGTIIKTARQIFDELKNLRQEKFK